MPFELAFQPEISSCIANLFNDEPTQILFHLHPDLNLVILFIINTSHSHHCFRHLRHLEFFTRTPPK